MNKVLKQRRLSCHTLSLAAVSLVATLSACSICGQAVAGEVSDIDRTFEVNEFSGITTSPDGKEVLYTVSKMDVSKNTKNSALMLTSLKSGKTTEISLSDRSTSVEQSSVSQAGAIEWRGHQRSFYWANRSGAINIWHIDQGTSEELLSASQLTSLFRNCTGVAVLQIHEAPSGMFLAIVANVLGGIDAHPLQGVEVDPNWSIWPGVEAPAVVSRPSRTTLVLVDLKTMHVTSPLPETMELAALDSHSVAWSPDESSLAFSASDRLPGGLGTNFMQSDLYRLQISSKQIDVLVKQPGYDLQPYWSPDGKRIAFKTLAGREDWNYNSQIGIVDFSTAVPKVDFPMRDLAEDPRARTVELGGWSRDNRSFFYCVPVRGAFVLESLIVKTGRIEDIAKKDDSDVCDWGGPAKARNADVMVTQGSDFNHSAELFVWQGGGKTLRQLTNLNTSASGTSEAKVLNLAWPSFDGKWKLQGYLLIPNDLQTKPPLIVYATGGPSEVTPYMAHIESTFPFALFLRQGYALFVPNTRGRQGFGEAFRNAFFSDHSINRVSAEDILSGVDFVIRQGLIDDGRIGIKGYSYGGGMAAYALSQTRLFKAASIHEAVLASLPDTYSNEPNRVAWSHIFGAASLFDTAKWKLLLPDLPTEHASDIKTPSLLEFGIQSLASTQGRQLFQALQYYKVASEFIIYPRTGHDTTEPALILDAYRRNKEWFDYWLKGEPTQRMVARYGKPLNTPDAQGVGPRGHVR
jgi:dipeptidyl aminopeptidase/acylaminoacyl peptidase